MTGYSLYYLQIEEEKYALCVEREIWVGYKKWFLTKLECVTGLPLKGLMSTPFWSSTRTNFS